MTHNDRCSHAETKRSKCKCSCGGELHGLQSQDYSRPKNNRDMYYICKDKFDFPDPKKETEVTKEGDIVDFETGKTMDEEDRQQ